MKINDVLANKMMDLELGTFFPECSKIISALLIQKVLKTGHVTNRCIQPNIKVFAGLAWNLKAEVGGISADISILQPNLQPLG